MPAMLACAIAFAMGVARADPSSDPVAQAHNAAARDLFIQDGLEQVEQLEELEREEPDEGSSFASVLVSIALVVPIMVLFAYCFKTRQKWPDRDTTIRPETLDTWSSSLFACGQDPHICLWAFFCPAIRWAGTMEIMGFMGFWAAFALLATLECLSYFYILTLLAAIVFIWVLTHFRNQMRASFGMQGANTCPGVCTDCLQVTFCTCCVIAQEARHVKAAAAADHEAVAVSKPVTV